MNTFKLEDVVLNNIWKMWLFDLLITNLFMSKTKGQTIRYYFGNETKMFWYRSPIRLVKNRWFWFGPESALLDQIEMWSFDGADSGTNSDVLVSFLFDGQNVCVTFVERLLLYFFDINSRLETFFMMEESSSSDSLVLSFCSSFP